MDFLCFYFPLFCIHWLMGYNLLYMKDRSLETGAKGIAAYVHSRLSVSLQGELPFDNEDIKKNQTEWFE